jgi:phage terminase large subunit-like protein
VARKNGKSTLAAAIMLILAFADEVPSGEPGAEAYTCATKRDQARIVHGEAVRMVRKSEMWSRNVKIYKDNLNRIEMAQKFEPLGMDADTADGLNIHAALHDELHAHKTREMWDVIETATGARRQPLIIAITTAGTSRQGICWEKHEYTCRVLDGVVEDDSWFGIIYTLDDGDDWRDESNWIKSNPNLGVSKKWSDMRIKAERARTMTSALNAFLQKELNVWVQGETKWMNMEQWRLCRGPLPALQLPEYLVGRPCYSGLDLSSTNDITAGVHVFPPLADNEPVYVICRFWIPEDNLIERCKRDGVPYDVWIRAG